MKYTNRNKQQRGAVVAVTAATVLVAACLALVFAQRRSALNERPRRVTASEATQLSSKVLKAGANLQAAIDRAQPGETILLEPGATFPGALQLPNKPGASYITIRSAAADSQLPAPNERLDPTKYAALLPKIVSDKPGVPALTATNGAHHYRFLGVEFGPVPGGDWNIISLGTADEKSLDLLPHHFDFDRVYIHGHPTDGQRRGIALNGRHVRIANSHFSDIKRKGEESQAICGWGGDGPFEIINNYIEAAAEGILFGGAAPTLRIVPSDITVRGNHFNKPLHWRNEGWVVKNHFEIKNGRRVTVDSNLMTNNWGGGQDGSAVLFTVRAEGGAAPQAIIEDVTFTNNIVRGAASVFFVLGEEGRGGHRLTIRNNLFEDIDGAKWSGRGSLLTISTWDSFVIENNTIFTTGNITNAHGAPVTGFVFRNNIIPHSGYGFHGDGAPCPTSLDKYFPGSVITNNAFISDDQGHNHHPRNMFLQSLKQLGFTNTEAGDYRLRAGSSLRKAGAGGADVGASLQPAPPKSQL